MSFEPRWSQTDLDALRRAVHSLEVPGLAIQVANRIGKPIEGMMQYLPKGTSEVVENAVHKALERALEVAISSLGTVEVAQPDKFHKAMAGLTGGIGGFFGLGALAMELPVSTTIMLRSIAEIARREGEDLDDTEGRLACLEVFALGGRSSADDAAETAYFTTRAALAQAIREAAQFMASRGLSGHGAPVLIRLIGQIASRFGIVVSEKAALQAVPVFGAIGGSTVNLLFIDHFQNVARGHFTVRRLERKYGQEDVQKRYEIECLRLGSDVRS
jgi:hypothetical protein